MTGDIGEYKDLRAAMDNVDKVCNTYLEFSPRPSISYRPTQLLDGVEQYLKHNISDIGSSRQTSWVVLMTKNAWIRPEDAEGQSF